MSVEELASASATSAASATTITSVKEVDYLDEDKPIRGQNFVLLSFISPEDVLVNKEAYMFSKFITKFSEDMTKLLDGISAKYSDSKDFVDSVKENNAFIFNPKDMSEQYGFYKSVNNQELETSYHRDNNFTTSIRGIKVRGVFDTIEEAKNRSEFVKKIDNKFNIYIAQVGCWCPWSPNPDCLENQEYAETQLNTLMKEYKKNMTDKDVIFDNRKSSMFASGGAGAAANEIVSITESTAGASIEDAMATATDEPETVELTELKDSIEKVDGWSSQKLGLE
jgi:hypothetical protein|uniref:Uncharacterized protein n=1 Tax=viral metagenome TaxID=1070528 RepID=A0A6C0CEZ0_9ZZZZ